MSALLDLLSKHLELVGLISEYRLLYAQFQKSEMVKSVDKDTMNKIALHIDIIDSTRFIFRNPQPRLEYQYRIEKLALANTLLRCLLKVQDLRSKL